MYSNFFPADLQVRLDAFSTPNSSSRAIIFAGRLLVAGRFPRKRFATAINSSLIGAVVKTETFSQRFLMKTKEAMRHLDLKRLPRHTIMATAKMHEAVLL